MSHKSVNLNASGSGFDSAKLTFVDKIGAARIFPALQRHWDTKFIVMRSALHPYTEQPIDPTQYIREFGHAAVGENGQGIKLDAICPFCRTRVYLAAETADRTAHFRHYPRATCPSTAPAGRPYLPLRPGNPDPEAGCRLRQAFRQNWRMHFGVIQHLVPYFSPEEFIELIETASANHVWDYVNFPEVSIPYALLLLRDFPPWTSTKLKGKHQRDLWLRFFYGHTVNAITALWILPQEEVVLHRASFIPPKNRRGRPAYEDLLKERILPIDREFLERTAPSFTTFIDRKVEDWFATHQRFTE